MRISHVFWPALILTSAVGVGVVTSAGGLPVLRPVVTLWFLLVCPGMAFVQLLNLRDMITRWTLAIALSVAIDMVVAEAFLYAGQWSPRDTLLVIAVITIVGADAQAVRGVSELVRTSAADSAQEGGAR
jgi:hypothetical protein